MSLKANAKSGVDGLDAAGELRMLPTHRKQRGALSFRQQKTEHRNISLLRPEHFAYVLFTPQLT
jgi:hypothetical protein